MTKRKRTGRKSIRNELSSSQAPPTNAKASKGMTSKKAAFGISAGVVALLIIIAVLLIIFGLAMVSRARTTPSRLGWIAFLCALGFSLSAALLVGHIRSVRGSISLDDASVLKPGSYDGIRLSRFRDSLDAVSIGAGVKAPDIKVVDLPAPLAYLAGSEYDSVFAITYELLDADFTSAEIEAIVAVLLAKTIVHPALCLRKQARNLEINPAMLAEIRSAYGNGVGGFNNIGLDCLMVILTDTFAVRETGNPMALESAIVKSAKMLEAEKVRVRGLDLYSWCTIFVGPPVAGLVWSWMLRSWREIIKLRVDNLEMIKAGRGHPIQGIIDRLSLPSPGEGT
jgi:hypothetical protein